MTRTPFFLVLSVALLEACGGTTKNTGEVDATGDVPADGSGDMATDGTPDADPDAVADAVPDAEDEGAPDAVPDPVADGTPGEGAVGDPCVEDEECAGVPGDGRFCIDTLRMGGPGGMTWEFPEGYCSAECESDEDCGTGAVCVGLMMRSMCFVSCTSDGDCRESDGYTCSDFPRPTGDTYCLPPMG